MQQTAVVAVNVALQRDPCTFRGFLDFFPPKKVEVQDMQITRSIQFILSYIFAKWGNGTGETGTQRREEKFNLGGFDFSVRKRLFATSHYQMVFASSFGGGMLLRVSSQPLRLQLLVIVRMSTPR